MKWFLVLTWVVTNGTFDGIGACIGVTPPTTCYVQTKSIDMPSEQACFSIRAILKPHMRDVECLGEMRK